MSATPSSTGSYVDSPFHRYENGKDLSELPLESVADLECLVVRVPPGMTSIDEVPLPAAKVEGTFPMRAYVSVRD